MIPPVLIDCDGVLSDFVRSVLDLAALRNDVHGVTEADVTMWDFHTRLLHPDMGATINQAIARDEFVFRMREHEGAIAWLRQLEREHGEDNVFVCTSPWNAEWTAQRASWLERRGVPLRRQIQCSAKHLVSGYLVDDRPGVHAHRNWPTFCLDRPWNALSVEPLRGGYAEASAWLREVRGL